MHLFNPERGAKAYSYFGTIVKRYLIISNTKNYKRKIEKTPVEELYTNETYSYTLDEERPNIEKLSFFMKLQQRPRNSSKVRLHNRCRITGRPKGYFRDFGLSRLVLREMVHGCVLPGITKASW